MATKSTIEVPVEEQTIQSEVAPQEREETSLPTAEENNNEAEPVVDDIARLDKEGVLARLAERVGEKASYAGSVENAAEMLRRELREGDAAIVMGAGNIDRIFTVLEKDIKQ